jgi:hypothetical protein
MKSFLQFLRAAALYLVFVVGGLTSFLIIAPVFGYLPYSDRPGPGWHGSFPALSVQEFLANSWEMLQFGLFFLIAFAPAALLCAGLFYALARTDWRPLTSRLVAALASAFVTAFFMFGAAWYISAGLALLFLSIGLGALAGICLVPKRVPTTNAAA